MFDFGILNGTIVNEEMMFTGNVYIKEEKIAAVTDAATLPECQNTIDASGRYVFPGMIDVHAHLGNFTNGTEHPANSTAGAAIGGFTTCMDMPTNDPVISNKTLLQDKLREMPGHAYVDYGLYGALLKDNQADLAGLHQAGAISFKSFLSPCGGGFTSPNLYELRQALMEIRAFNGLAAFHCEDYAIIDGLSMEMQRAAGSLGQSDKQKDIRQQRQDFLDSRPLCAELIAVRSLLTLAKETGCRVHICHVSHPETARLIADARAQGVDVSGETCVHYLTFTQEDFLDKGCLYKCAPPLRDAAAREGLWEYVKAGVLSCIGSDHSPSAAQNKDDRRIPVCQTHDGISGIQTAIQVFFHQAVHQRRLSPMLMARCLSAAPAKRWRIYGKKGAVKPGFDADIVILDPNQEWEITDRQLSYLHKISAYSGMRGKGLPVLTMLRGRVIAQNGQLTAPAGEGKPVFDWAGSSGPGPSGVCL